MIKDAIFSPCGLYRYWLVRRWDSGPALVFVMLNPSTAGLDLNDPTIRRCMAFGRSLGFSAIEAINLFALRATDPAQLRTAVSPIGEDNDLWILRTAEETVQAGNTIVAAWGANSMASTGRVAAVLSLIRSAGPEPKCLGLTQSGAPRHPLYLPSSAQLQPFH